MKQPTCLYVCVGLLAGLALLCRPAAAQATDPVAIVYVSQTASPSQANSPNVVNAYSADSSGRLTPISGSPFPADVQFMAVNGRFLFGSSTNQQDIDTFRMAPNGALTQVDSFNAQMYTPGACGQPQDLVLDHTGSSLYILSGYYGISQTCSPDDTVFQSLGINKTSGALTFLGDTNTSGNYGYPLRFASNNVYAYEASAGVIYGFKRQSDGNLVYYNTTTHLPTPPSGQTYQAIYAAADPDHHLAVILQDFSSTGDLPAKIATYTISPSGELTTTSTSSNMPAMASATPYYSQMSPSGKLLAVSGNNGLQIFHFNGARPVTPYTGPLTPHQVDQMFWDNANHLYALARLENKLYVFTVTPTSYSQAPGSPYTVNIPWGLIVQPR